MAVLTRRTVGALGALVLVGATAAFLSTGGCRAQMDHSAIAVTTWLRAGSLPLPTPAVQAAAFDTRCNWPGNRVTLPDGEMAIRVQLWAHDEARLLATYDVAYEPPIYRLVAAADSRGTALPVVEACRLDEQALGVPGRWTLLDHRDIK